MLRRYIELAAVVVVFGAVALSVIVAGMGLGALFWWLSR